MGINGLTLGVTLAIMGGSCNYSCSSALQQPPKEDICVSDRIVSAAYSTLFAVANAAKEAKTVNFTTYRVTPITYPGLANMDSGDAGVMPDHPSAPPESSLDVPPVFRQWSLTRTAQGDVFFGLSQLLLPQLCAVDESFLWCQNRAYLSGGSAWMVYSGFVVVTRDAFGEYEACNPCQGHGPSNGHEVQVCPDGVPNGTFVCQSYNDQGPTPPPQCKNGFQIWHEDCLNGTVYKTLAGLAPSEAEGACCAACSADKDTCAGWNMPKGDNGTTCQLMKEPLVMWNGGQTESKCKAAQVDHSEYRCWYNNPQYAAFAPYCNRSECSCDVIDNHVAVGLESNAMCHQDSASLSALLKRTTPRATVSTAAADYWQCTEAVGEVCFNGYMPAPHCSECALDSSHWPSLQKSGCTADMIPHVCSADFTECSHKIEQYCGQTVGHSSSCATCLKEHTRDLENANCTALFANYACSGGGHRDNHWEEYIESLACHMHGNWYSTTSTGECKGKELTPDCWWYIDSEIRTINASCADGMVISKVQASRPECWTACPGNEGKNVSSACYLDCLFQTILGNTTAGIPSMDATVLEKTFSDAFTMPVGQGGCQAVHKPEADDLVTVEGATTSVEEEITDE